ncbi:MAG: coenzyme F420-0:L-glutamate ligase [Acidobacteriota bacterium]|nr:coenzyme F420-0:L-glutamate ligase [Acidobacteriota bacterium]
MGDGGVRILAIPGLPEVKRGDALGPLLLEALRGIPLRVRSGDILVLAHKIVSKAEGRTVPLAAVAPSPLADSWAREWGRDPRVVELALTESRRIVKMDRGVLLAETRHGFVCANAGVDLSNSPQGTATLLPEDPDRSAAAIRDCLIEATGSDLAVIISDTFGRPWREGQVNVAIGMAGGMPLSDYRGRKDGFGRTLRATCIARADEIASAAELVMGKRRRVPAALVRGVSLEDGPGDGSSLVRPAERDLFR